MKALNAVLIGLFLASTIIPQEQRGEHCESCQEERSCASADAPVDAPGHAHGDEDDHHESPDSPCHHHQESHCCCTHVPTLTTASAFAPESPRIGLLFSLVGTRVRLDPSLHEFFHVPIV